MRAKSFFDVVRVARVVGPVTTAQDIRIERHPTRLRPPRAQWVPDMKHNAPVHREHASFLNPVILNSLHPFVLSLSKGGRSTRLRGQRSVLRLEAGGRDPEPVITVGFQSVS